MLVTNRSTWMKVELPNEEITITLRPLTDDEWSDCLDKELDRIIAKQRAMGAEVINTLPKSQPNAQPNYLLQIHHATALQYALVAWTYEEECTRENVSQLDHQTVEFLAGKVVEMNAPRPLSNGNHSDSN